MIGCTGTRTPGAQTPETRDEVGQGTGAVTSIVPSEADASLARVEDVLQNRVPGLQVLRLPDGTYTLRLRGRRSLRGNPADEEPLLVVDGQAIPSGSVGSTLAGLAPRDIARIEVLRDAAATGIYGSRGASGVIIITTRRAND